MHGRELIEWRKRERRRLLAARESLEAQTLERLRHAIDAVLASSFPELAEATLAFCWPIRGEYDARHFAGTLRGRGALTALPVVVAPDQPLVFREWHPGIELAMGPLDIPYPKASAEVMPSAVLLPMTGWDRAGYRLGYGGGFFDRTLAALNRRPTIIGVGYELGRLDTIHPQPWDVPVDWVVTERGLYRRDPDGLSFQDKPAQ
ncbi:MAG: 5-formyltetrahydrofolate cyclo-ligase [Betaproteobacteria bacterium]|nr:5-formyltetrahydrofolate cyclo-ligase [Betaproteobacteria bacterium]